MQKIKLVFHNNYNFFVISSAFAAMLLLSLRWGGFKIGSFLLQSSFFLMLSVCMQHVVKSSEEILQSALCSLCILITIFFLLFFSNQYLRAVTLGKAGWWLVLLLAVWVEYLFRTPWLLLLFAVVLLIMDSGFTVLILPGLALMACVGVQPATDGKKKKKKQEEDIKLQNIWNCYLPALLLCISAAGVTIYKCIQKGEIAVADKAVWLTLANVGVRIMPFSIPPAVLFYEMLRNNPKCFLYKEMLWSMLLPFFVLPLALLAGEERLTLFSAFMALVLMQYALLFILLHRKQIHFTKILESKREFLGICLLLCVPIALRQLWDLGSILFL